MKLGSKYYQGMSIQTEIHNLDFQNETIFVKRKYVHPNVPVILYFHGLKYSTEALWDLAIEGKSAMDHLALAGFDVWSFDLPGLGNSSRPETINGDLDYVLNSIKRVISFIETKNLHNMNVIAWSAGCTWAMNLAQTINFHKMVLISPRVPMASSNPPRIAKDTYRYISPEDIITSWLGPYDQELKNKITTPQTIELYKNALSTSDQAGNKLRVPLYLQNLMEIYSSGTAKFFDVKKIKPPVGIICGELDSQASDSKKLFDELEVPKDLKYVKDSTHWLIIENSRMELINFCRHFLV